MIDLQILREQENWVKEGVSKKKFEVDWELLGKLDIQRREAVSAAEQAKADQNAVNKEISKMDKSSDEFKARVAQMQEMAAKAKELAQKAKDVDLEWSNVMMTIPNVPHESVPLGKGEEDNQVVMEWGDKKVSAHAKAHYDIEWFNALLDFERGAKVTGAGFPFYRGPMARLVRSLIRFFLEEGRKAGYEEMMTPFMVNADSAFATGQLPDKEGQMYHAVKDDFYMIPTAEVPVTNFYRDETFEEKDLPVKHCGHTPCFRREAGSWGKHVRGLNRLHQFDKVELVKWVHPDESFHELELLQEHAQKLLKDLELPYRLLLICGGDIGFAHSKQYDLEVWSGGQERWLEVSSCSNFTDFQARRAGTRFRPKEGGKAQYVHTLNGSGLAIPRVLAALLENNLQEDGTVKLPKALVPYYGQEYFSKED